MAQVELVDIPRVELVKVGKWPAVTGPAEITLDKLQSMLDASKAPWWDKARIKLGHFDRRFLKKRDGDPAYGRVENLHIEDGSLYGDLKSMPSRLAKIIQSAYPNRSIEWEENIEGPDGQTYPAVLRGLALLGATEPGVEGLAPIEDLEDVYEIYAASQSAERPVFSAFVGDRGDAIVNALSALSEIIHAPIEKTVHDMGTVQLVVQELSSTQGDEHMTDTLDKLRELLEVGADADLEAEIRKLKTKAEDKPDEQPETPKPADPSTPQTNPNEVTPTVPTEVPDGGDKDDKDKPDTPADVPAGSVVVTQAYLEDLAAKANAGAEAAKALHEQRVEGELLAASKEGRLAPAELAEWRAFMADPRQFNAGLKLLSQRPKVMHTSDTGSALDTPPDADAEFNQLVGAIFSGGVR